MKWIEEFRDPDLGRALLAQIERECPQRPLKIMEVCGGHTHAIYRHGLEQLLPPQLELVHGPGCPVCVIPTGRVDDALAIALEPEVIFTSYGDMLAVPGSRGSLQKARAQGADVRVVYSPLDSLRLAAQNPQKRVVFFAVGFETTAPATAVAVLQARQQGLKNLSFFCNHVVLMPALTRLLEDPEMQLDGLIGPGHVSTVIGLQPYSVISQDYARPLVVSGFEPLDILQSLLMVVRQIREGVSRVENQYTRAVSPQGNPQAQACIAETMELRQTFEWRGLGCIPDSALKLREEFADWDAERLYSLPGRRVADPKACQCGEVLQGKIKPFQCRVFGTACKPETPIGTCMVSPEGACAAYYQYGRLGRI